MNMSRIGHWLLGLAVAGAALAAGALLAHAEAQWWSAAGELMTVPPPVQSYGP